MTISHTTKTHRRRAAQEAALIGAALWAQVPTWADDTAQVGYAQAMSASAGMGEIGGVAREVARYPRGSAARSWVAFHATSADLCGALQNCTVDYTLELAGLL